MMSTATRKVLAWMLAVGCLVGAGVICWRSRDQIQLAYNLAPIKIMTLLALLVVYYVLHGARYWLVLVKSSGRTIPYGSWFRIFVLGLFINKFIPQGGSVYRAVTLKRDHGVSYTRYISAYAGFAWIDCFVSVILTILAVLIVDPTIQLGGVPALYVLLPLSVAVALGPFGLLVACRSIERVFHRRPQLYERASEAIQVMVETLRDPLYLLKIVGMCVVVFCLVAWIFYVGFESFGIHLNSASLAVFCTLFLLSCVFR